MDEHERVAPLGGADQLPSWFVQGVGREGTLRQQLPSGNEVVVYICGIWLGQ